MIRALKMKKKIKPILNHLKAALRIVIRRMPRLTPLFYSRGCQIQSSRLKIVPLLTKTRIAPVTKKTNRKTIVIAIVETEISIPSAC